MQTWVGFALFFFFSCVPPDFSVPRLAISGSEGSAAGGQDTMSPIVLLHPLAGGGHGRDPTARGHGCRTWCERARPMYVP